ncbi:hypothetical protein EDC01DRAFT_69057 [Geopyxis carbonaria]|nr:hypothetical protein EDC01DRAFT_69057 [Geopyxis carbonaria]
MATKFSTYSTANEIVQAFSSRVTGKTILITGPSAGSIGAAIAAAVAVASPARLLLAGRTASKIPLPAECSSQFIDLDLSNQASVRRSAAEINKICGTGGLDILINNAAILCPPELTMIDGIEAQFGVNHIGHFLLTNLIVPSLAPNARIVNVSSTGYTLGEVPFKDMAYESGYNPWKAYAASKTANLLFTVSLQAKLVGKTAVAVHPGQPRSNLAKHLDAGALVQAHQAQSEMPQEPVTQEGDDKTLEQAAGMVLDAALNPRWETEGAGKFLRNCEVFPVHDYAKNPKVAEELWRVSEKYVGETFLY